LFGTRERLLHAALNGAQTALDGGAGGFCSARCQLLDLALELAIFLDELSDHRVQLRDQVTAAKLAAICSFAAWWTAATPSCGRLLALRGFVCCHFGS
jgi:hypothetical protein